MAIVVKVTPIHRVSLYEASNFSMRKNTFFYMFTVISILLPTSVAPERKVPKAKYFNCLVSLQRLYGETYIVLQVLQCYIYFNSTKLV